MRDYQPGIDYTLVNTIDVGQSLAIAPPPVLDPVVQTGAVLPTLATLLGIPMTVYGKVVREIRASDLASIQTLDLSNFKQKTAVDLVSTDTGNELAFLSYMTNLRSLNLSGNPLVTSLEMLRPRIDFTTGAQLGAAQLRHLMIDDTGVTSLAPISTLTELRSLSADRLISGWRVPILETSASSACSASTEIR